MESSRLGVLKYAISAGQDIRPKNKSIRKCKNDIVRRAYMVTDCGQVQTGSDRFGQVRTGVKHYFSSTVSRTLAKSGPPPKLVCSFLTVPHSNLLRPFEVVETAFCHASIGVRCELVWSATFLGRTSTGDTALESSRLAQFEYEISPG